MKVVILLLGLQLVFSQVLQGVVRDFTPQTNPDFERYTGYGEKGIILNRIGSDRKPVYNDVPHSFVTSKASFDQWYRDVPGTNIPISIQLPLTNIDGRLYSYNNQAFFPIDGRGFGNYGNSGHNFHFTFEVHSRFSYVGGEVFSFDGDDDTWVFINDNLVIDLGGVHPSQKESVSLDTLGLAKGTNYRFDFFSAERHTTESHCRIDTTVEFYCAYYDHCDICEGNGQSCCTCNDGNPCTIDTCTVTTGDCIYTPMNCDDNNKCTNDYCSGGTCVHQDTSSNCNDGNPCTIDTCDPSYGCVFTPMVCNDNSLCTTDACVNGQCVFTPINCNDNNACTTDSCVAATGCSHVNNVCNTTIGCTIGCAGTCLNNVALCDDGNPCTTDTCDTSSGTPTCVNTPVTCDMSNPCVPQYCNRTTGSCDPAPITCDDSNICTIDTCVNNQNGTYSCNHTANPCDDLDPCTIDFCSLPGGCNHTVNTCDDGNECTIDSCDSKTGCVHTDKSCEDGLFCTDHACEPGVGCLTFNKTCVPDKPDCQVGVCNEATRTCSNERRSGIKNPLLCFDELNAEEKGAVIGVGGIVGIAIGAAVFAAILAFTGKKGYDAYMKHRNNMSGAQTNPMYNDSGRSGVNPFHVANA